MLSAFQQSSSSPGQSTAGTDTLLAPAVPAVRGRYLDATPTVTASATANGRSFTLALDVAPKPGIHVYAPGNRDYLPVALTIDALPDVRLGPVQFPKANVFFFAPLNERVQVYSQAFRLTRSVTLEGTAKPAPASGVVLTGRLEYQACDDKVCYLPQTVPLSWTVPVQR